MELNKGTRMQPNALRSTSCSLAHLTGFVALLFALGFGVFALSQVAQSCIASQDGSVSVVAIDDIPQADFDRLADLTQRVAKVSAARVVSHGVMKADELERIGTELHRVANLPTSFAGPAFILDALEQSGLHNDEALLLFVAVDYFIAARVRLPDVPTIMGQRHQHLLVVVAQGIIDGARSGATDAQVSEADALVQERKLPQ